ncbi:MAG: glycerophosphodiester phosphodiesterase family protein, partial [bacterium]
MSYTAAVCHVFRKTVSCQRLIGSALVIAFLVGSCGGDHDSSSLSVESPAAYFQLMDPAATTPMVAAHRGYHDNVPENSVASIRAAAQLGADFSEIDVRHTQDGILVLMHDSTVSRTTDGAGEVASMTYAQIQTLTLNGGIPSDPETSRVPTFAQALAAARESRIMLYVDVKTSRDDLVQAAVQAGPYYDVALLC